MSGVSLAVFVVLCCLNYLWFTSMNTVKLTPVYYMISQRCTLVMFVTTLPVGIFRQCNDN